MRKLAAIVFLPLVLGCADDIGRAELLSRIRSESPPVVVDVRSQGEYQTSHVPGAVRISFYAVIGGIEDIPEAISDDQTLVVYCEHGPRAGIARAQLWFVTDRPIRFLEGHMTAWKEDGLPVEPELAATE